jgi:hypothetical protein
MRPLVGVWIGLFIAVIGPSHFMTVSFNWAQLYVYIKAKREHAGDVCEFE